jgi:hypothetical protein
MTTFTMYQTACVRHGDFETGGFHATREAAIAECDAMFTESGVTYVDAEELTSDGGFRRIYRRRTIGQAIADTKHSVVYCVRCAILKAQRKL